MKKVLLFLIIAATICGCSADRKWTEEQKRELKQMLEVYRDMVYLQNMTDAEYVVFADDVADTLENGFPNYVSFIALPAVNDTIQTYVVATIVSDIQANHRNMRHIFPYEVLVQNNVLPIGMERAQLLDFYTCLAEDVNNYFGSMQAFIYGALNSNLDDAVIANFQQQCAAPFWGSESVTIIEGTN